MFSIIHILKNQGLKSSQVFSFQCRRFRTSAYLTSTSNQKAIKALQKFKLKQAKMQRDDGVPTYLKCGTRDKILFNMTLVVLIFESVDVARMIHKLIHNIY